MTSLCLQDTCRISNISSYHGISLSRLLVVRQARVLEAERDVVLGGQAHLLFLNLLEGFNIFHV